MPSQPTRSSLIGPLAGWELVRLARRGQSHRARLMLLYILTLTFVGFAVYWFSHDTRFVPLRDLFLGNTTLSIPHTAAEFGSNFALVVLLANLGVVAVITPAYAVSAIAEEKDRKTLPLLLNTALTDREIVFGKAAARAGFVLAAVFAGAPVVMIASLFGGIDFAFLVAGYLLIVGTTVLTTAIGIYAACVAPDFRSAIGPAYALTVFLVGSLFCIPLLSPFGILVMVHGADGWMPLIVGAGYALCQCLLGVYYLLLAVRSLRYEDQPPPLKSDFPLPPMIDLTPVRSEVPRLDLPPLDPDRPVLWKERCLMVPWAVPRRVAVTLVAWLGCLVMVVGAGVLAGRDSRHWVPEGAARVVGRYPEPPDAGGRLLMTGAVLALGAYVVPLAVGIAGLIARERERRTLDSLLMLPLDRGELLRTKLHAYAEPAWPLGVVSVVAVGLAFGADGGLRLGLAAGAAALAGVGLVIGLGTWLSVRCPGSLWAFRMLLPAVVVVVGLPVAAWNAIDWATAGRWEWGFGSAAAVFGLAGLVFWRRAVRELEQGG